jgi:hypothetical protein
MSHHSVRLGPSTLGDYLALGSWCPPKPGCDMSGVHQTVRWANGATINCTQRSTAVKSEQCRSQNCKVRTHRTVWCRKRTKDFNCQLLQTPTVGWYGTHRTMNNAMSGAPPDCPVCPSTATTGIVVGAINTPNHHHSSHPSFQTFTFNTRAKAYTPRHNQKIKSSSSLKINSSA